MDLNGGENRIVELGSGDEWREQLAQGGGLHEEENKRSGEESKVQARLARRAWYGLSSQQIESVAGWGETNGNN